MADNQNSENKVLIPAGWERRGEGYYCRDTAQGFESLDALIRYVTYAKIFQPELFDYWSASKSSPQNKKGRKREDAEDVSSLQKKTDRKLKGKCQATVASVSTSPMDSEGELSIEDSCEELAGCEQGTSSGKQYIFYERRRKLSRKKETNA